MIIHTVLFKWKLKVSEREKEKAKEWTSSLAKCAGVTKVVAGPNISPEGAGKGFDYGFVMEITDESFLNYYLNEDITHKEFKEKISFLVDDVLVYDISA